ncbi:MAG: methylated-DNA-protein-cysteine methyltransferase-like protein [Marinoscillum sp.]|jgi:methylated-DNA-protein-cysteine methyltransferase-like protein
MKDFKANFFADVYEIVKLVPEGRVTSYGAIANYLGLKRSARMVGWAMNQAHAQPEIPAHRVVNRQGLLTGKHHFGSSNLMQELLESEGVIVKEDKIQDFQKVYWDPMEELKL